jgi:manganese transport protein
MEGFLGSSFKVKPWIRRVITRCIAVIPAMVVAVVGGRDGVNELLVLSQVVLSFQLPFAVWPLIWFTSRGDVMDKNGVKMANSRWVIGLVFVCGVLITGLNLFLVASFIFY